MKLSAYIDQRQALLAVSNESGNVEKEIDITQLTQNQRAMLARRMDLHGVVSGYNRGILDLENLREWLIEMIATEKKQEAERAAHLKNKEEKLALEMAEFQAAFAARKTSQKRASELYRGERIEWDSTEIDCGSLSSSVMPNDLKAELKIWRDEIAVQNAGAQAAARAAADEKMASVKTERDKWIAARGSKRLKLAAKEDIECQAIYRDERLALERPGWAWAVDYRGEYSEPRNPALEALESLEIARKSAPDAKLAYWEADADTTDDGDEIEGFRGYCAIARFFDREIVFGLPDTLIED